MAAGHDVTVIDVRPSHRSDVRHADVDIRDVDALAAATVGVEALFHLAAYADVSSLPPVSAKGGHMLALVVDDSSTMRRILRRIVAERGHFPDSTPDIAADRARNE